MSLTASLQSGLGGCTSLAFTLNVRHECNIWFGELELISDTPAQSILICRAVQVGVAGMFVMGGGYLPGTVPQALGALAVLLASVNVAGGFILTKRMLDMFKRKSGGIS